MKLLDTSWHLYRLAQCASQMWAWVLIEEKDTGVEMVRNLQMLLL